MNRYEHSGSWRLVEYCDRCGREIEYIYEAHFGRFGYEALCSACYTAVYLGQPKVYHFEQIGR
jgi:hypothetical protein